MERGIDRLRQAKAAVLAGVTLNQAYEAYSASKVLAAKTLIDYDRAMRRAFGAWRTLALVKITGGMVARRFDEVSQQAPVQANQMFRFLRALLGWAMWKYAQEDGTPLLAANLCEILTKLKRWNRVERRDRHIEPVSMRSFMGALEPCADDRKQRSAVKDLCALLTLTGLREQEGCGLLREDVDLDRRTIKVRDTKNGKDHKLPIGPWLTARLAARMQQAGPSRFVFPANNKCGHLKHHRKHVLAIAKASGVEFRLHDLRRTFATIVEHPPRPAVVRLHDQAAVEPL